MHRSNFLGWGANFWLLRRCAIVQILAGVLDHYYPDWIKNGRDNAKMNYVFKGQLISKCLFDTFNSPKKRTKKFNYTKGQKISKKNYGVLDSSKQRNPGRHNLLSRFTDLYYGTF